MKTEIKTAGAIARLKNRLRKRRTNIFYQKAAKSFYLTLAKNGWTAKSYGFVEGGV